MSYTDYSALAEDQLLTEGVLTRRIVAWFADIFLIGCLVAVLWVVCLAFGIVTLGLGWPVFGILPLVPFFYNFLFLSSHWSATPGQALLGLSVRDNHDLGPPAAAQALVSTLLYYVTLATSGLLLLIALFTARHRTLHDLLSGLVVVRARALTPASGVWNMATGSPYR